jgi:uncharacterized membrane protein HdeD (DUF308 family)
VTDISMPRPAMAQVRDHWGWFLALGIAFIVGGIFAIAMPFAGSIAVAIVVGWALIFVGAVQVIQAWSIRTWGGFAWQLVIGLIVLVGGIAMLINPIVAAITLALLIGAMFLAKGIMQILFAFRYRPHSGWGWILAAGILAIVVALMIISSWPFSGFWVPGTLVGISLIFSGWSYVMIALAGRRLTAT